MTQRHVAQSFWVITGTTSERRLSEDLLQAAQTTATVVVLLGSGTLREIVQIFKRMGKDALPVAVIMNGTMKNERKAVGTVDTILQEVQKRHIATPAIIVLGEVVRHAQQLKGLFAEIESKSTLQLA